MIVKGSVQFASGSAKVKKLYDTYKKNFIKKAEKANKIGVGMKRMYTEDQFRAMYREGYQTLTSQGLRTNNLMQNLVNAQVNYAYSPGQAKEIAEFYKTKAKKFKKWKNYNKELEASSGVKINRTNIMRGKINVEEFWKSVQDKYEKLRRKGYTGKEANKKISDYFFGSL